METLESSRVCRLCGQQSGISINIFDENENHVRKINAVLPIMVHEMDLLPKHMCHRCSYKLEEFHKFYVDCLKTDAALKSQLSWMQKGCNREKTGVPMVHIENVNIKTEPLDYDVYDLEPIVENIDYINSMAKSMTFSAGGIHDGLTYAAFSHCRCCCDKKDQSRCRTAELCQNYEESVSRCSKITDNSRKRTLKDTLLRPARKRSFTHPTLQDRPEKHLARLDTSENARVRLGTTDTKDVSSLDMLNSHGKQGAVPINQITTKDTIVRNLRPRKSLINYALNKKRMLDVISESSVKNKANAAKTTSASNFELMQQIKVEQMDELETRSLRPRKNIVNYFGPKTRKGTPSESKLARHEQIPTKKRKTDDMGQSLKLRSRNKNDLSLKIKQEALDDPKGAVFGETTSASSVLPKNRAKIADLRAKIGVLSIDGNFSDDVTNYLKPNQSQSRNKFQLAKRMPIVADIAKNRQTKSKKTNRPSAVNYALRSLRSQDLYLRNGKTRRYDCVEWPMKKSRTRKLMDAVTKNATMLKLAESIKHYCEACNVSFMNTELFRLHACYYD